MPRQIAELKAEAAQADNEDDSAARSGRSRATPFYDLFFALINGFGRRPILANDRGFQHSKITPVSPKGRIFVCKSGYPTYRPQCRIYRFLMSALR
jgi:hypothetical protein